MSVDDLFGPDSSDDEGEPTALGRLEENGVMVFHSGTEQKMLLHVKQALQCNDVISGGLEAERVLAAIDDFCITKHWMMHVGGEKSEILAEALRKRGDVGVVLELGTYCGFSAVMICMLLSGMGNKNFKLHSIEIDERNAAVAREIVSLAGFEGAVEIVVAHDVENGMAEIIKRRGGGCKPFIDVLFIDHDKDCYLSDLKVRVLESRSDELRRRVRWGY